MGPSFYPQDDEKCMKAVGSKRGQLSSDSGTRKIVWQSLPCNFLDNQSILLEEYAPKCVITTKETSELWQMTVFWSPIWWLNFAPGWMWTKITLSYPLLYIHQFFFTVLLRYPILYSLYVVNLAVLEKKILLIRNVTFSLFLVLLHILDF